VRILVVSYFFPPTQSVGVVRIAKCVKYWRALGAEVAVVTSDDIQRRANLPDASLQRDVAGVPLTVARMPIPPRLLTRIRPSQAAAGKGGPPPGRGEAALRGLGRSIMAVTRRVRDHVLVPDFAIPWALPAIRAALRLHRRTPFDLVFGSGNPWSNLVAASIIARRLGLPSAIDLRDPWGDGPLFDFLPPWTRVERWAQRRLEAAVCERAAILTVTTGHIAAELRRRALLRADPVVIENGYDPADVEGALVPPPDPGVFRIVMTSQFRAGDRFRPFTHALRRCVDRGLPSGRELVFTFAGEERLAPHLPSIGDYLAEQGLEGRLDERGFLGRRDALVLQRTADLCLFVEKEFSNVAGGMVGTEFYEYLGTGRRVLLLDDAESAVWQVGERAGTVVRCARDDEDAIFAALSSAMSGRWEATPNWAWIERFSRAEEARRMLELFERAVAPMPPREGAHPARREPER
jgi:hypothetical protein